MLILNPIYIKQDQVHIPTSYIPNIVNVEIELCLQNVLIFAKRQI